MGRRQQVHLHLLIWLDLILIRLDSIIWIVLQCEILGQILVGNLTYASPKPR